MISDDFNPGFAAAKSLMSWDLLPLSLFVPFLMDSILVVKNMGWNKASIVWGLEGVANFFSKWGGSIRKNPFGFKKPLVLR